MSSTGKWVVGVIIFILILGAAFWYFSPKAQAPGTMQTTTFPSQPSGDTGLQTSSSDTSSAALDQDTAAIDAQLQALDSDSAAIDESLNDKPIQ